jgi:hypothetical protein
MKKFRYPGWNSRIPILGSLYCLGPFCLVTFRIRSGKGNANGKPHTAISSAYLTASCISSALHRARRANPITRGVIMGTWLWLNIPLAVLFVCCRAGIPLWLTLTRWNAEISARHAAIAAKASPAPVFAPPAPAVTHGTGSPGYAEVTGPPGR